MKGEPVELPLVASRAFLTTQIIVLAPSIGLRVRRTVFLHRKLVQLAQIELYGKLRENPPL